MDFVKEKVINGETKQRSLHIGYLTRDPIEIIIAECKLRKLSDASSLVLSNRLIDS